MSKVGDETTAQNAYPVLDTMTYTPKISKPKIPQLNSGQRGFLIITTKSVDKSAKLSELINLFEKFYEDEESYSEKDMSVISSTSFSLYSELKQILSSSSDKLGPTNGNYLDLDGDSSESSSKMGDGKHNEPSSTHSQSTVTDDQQQISPESDKENIANDPVSGCSKNVIETTMTRKPADSERPITVETIPVSMLDDSSSDSSTSVRLQFHSNKNNETQGRTKPKKSGKKKSKPVTETSKTKSVKDTKETRNFLPSHIASINAKKYENVEDIPPDIKKLFRTPFLNDDSPFIPILSVKPNAIMKLSLHEIHDTVTKKTYFENPYSIEIDRWIPKTDSMHLKNNYQLRQLHETPYNVIHTEGKFEILIKDLKTTSEFAFSTLQSNRSYNGFTCVIGISTRYKDYIIDCFGLRDLLQKLNIFFTHPGVLKVAHNCRTDIEYLQKDFGIYVVGLFDVSEAEKTIKSTKSRKSIPLDQLLREYLKLKFNTKFQKADWRIREKFFNDALKLFSPLPKSMTEYARSRSHYLLKIFDMQREKLLTGNNREALYQVYENSKEYCRVHYEQPDRTSWVLKYKSVLSNQQMYALVATNEWRNEVAAGEDESPEWIASNKALVAMSTVLPSKYNEIVSSSKKHHFAITPYIEQDKRRLLHIFGESKDLPLVTPQIQVSKRRVVECCLSTKVSTLVFLKTKHEDHGKIVYKMMEHFQAEGNFACPSYIQRILPVDVTCKDDLNHICEALEALVDISCKSESETYEIHSNFRFDKQYTLIAAIRKVVKKKKPRWTYTEDGSDICVIIYSIRKLRRCCVSFVDSYRKFNQFYLRSP